MRFIFGIKEGCYFEMEKPLGEDSGVAIHSDAWGIVNDRIALSDSESSHSFHDELGSSLHDMAHNIIENTREFINTAREYVYGGRDRFSRASELPRTDGHTPQYGHRYSSVFSPILSTCLSDSTHDSAPSAASVGKSADKTRTHESTKLDDCGSIMEVASTDTARDDMSVGI